MGFADFVDGGVVAGRLCEVEPDLVGAADAVGDGFGEPVGFGPDDLGAEDEAEVVDGAEGVSPGDADEGLRWDAWPRVAAVGVALALRFGADESGAVSAHAATRVAITEVDPD
jgi:hypothetical protein